MKSLASNSGVLLVVILFLFLASAVSNAAEAWKDDNWLLQRFRTGDLDTLRELAPRIPEKSAAGQFFRGIFETDGEAARFYFDRAVALYPGSVFESWALERLWQYHWAKGDSTMAERYWSFLSRRHPDHPSSAVSPGFRNSSDLQQLTNESTATLVRSEVVSRDYWTVQLGAFKNREGAEKVGFEARAWGKVKLINKKVRGQDLTVVQVGHFLHRDDAVELDKKIRSETDLRGRVVKVEND